jgi:hypothetical protein
MDRQMEQYGLIRTQYTYKGGKDDKTHRGRMYAWVMALEGRAGRFRSPLTAHPFVDILILI